MAFIHRFKDPLQDGEGRAYRVEAHGQQAETGLWEGRLEFVGIGRRVTLTTAVETTQPDEDALRYWALGLEPTYLEGAFARAIRARMGALRRS
jgi:hypothetical protein